MKKLTLLFVLLIGLFSIVQSASAEISEGEIEVNVNGQFVSLDVKPVISQSRTFLPIRSLASLNLSYKWDTRLKRAVIQNPAGDALSITVNSKIAYKNEQQLTMEAPAISKEGRVLVPIRFVTEALGYQVQFESIRNIIFITSADFKPESQFVDQNDLAAARRAAISLPISSGFEPLNTKTRYDHKYFFPGGRADVYGFSDGYTESIVEIKDGRANLLGQWVESPAGGEVLFSAGTAIFYGDAVLEPLVTHGVLFRREGNTVKASYWKEGGEEGMVTGTYKVYSDLIQSVPAGF